jgi:hypothetical protein
MPGHFTSDMGFTHQIEEGLARGWGWHAPELSVPGTQFIQGGVLALVAEMAAQSLATAEIEIRDLGSDNRVVSYASALCAALDA